MNGGLDPEPTARCWCCDTMCVLADLKDGVCRKCRKERLCARCHKILDPPRRKKSWLAKVIDAMLGDSDETH